MDRNRLTPPADPEFRSPRPVLRAEGLNGEPESYLRLVANPFLALVYVVAWLAALYQLVIVGILAVTVTTSLVANKRKKAAARDEELVSRP